MGRNEYLLPLALCGALALSACSSANKDWATATAQNTAAAYQSFLSQHAGDPHAQDHSQGTATALQAFLQQYPQGSEADQARQMLQALNSEFRAELGAFRDKRAADRKLVQLKTRFSSVLKQVEVLSPDSSNKRYRVMSGLMDRHAADSTCLSLEREHQNCEVVKAGEARG